MRSTSNAESGTRWAGGTRPTAATGRGKGPADASPSEDPTQATSDAVFKINGLIAELDSRQKQHVTSRSDQRYVLSAGLKIRRAGALKSAPQPAYGMNISLGGMALITTRPCTVGETLLIDLSPVVLEPCRVEGMIVHCSEVLPQVWRVGASFDFG